ncbi:hypothetical protein LRD69_28025 [Streptomyces sp. JH14]|uniref:MFS transporter n=1 Tax=Streptomyces sp. JH14 TaxID=2793630 RepID=UPI0023F706A0|nr:MFS transporter [Streptomyces sp. JH14]MDF6045913.1 hypothetical protein [Streptomyces sp. JH14]
MARALMARVAAGIRRRRTTAAEEPSWQSVSAAMTSLILNPEELMNDLIALRLGIYRQPVMAAAMPRLLAFTHGGQHLGQEEWAQIKQPVLVVAAVRRPQHVPRQRLRHPCRGSGRRGPCGACRVRVATVLCAVAPTMQLFLAARTLQGVANAFTTPLLVAAISDLVGAARLGRALSWFAAAQAAGQGMSPLFSVKFPRDHGHIFVMPRGPVLAGSACGSRGV